MSDGAYRFLDLGTLFQRRGDVARQNRVRDLIEAGQAAWCAFVRLELWNGVGSDADRRMLREHEIWLPDLPIAGPVWQDACELASRCRRVGKSAPANDVLIAACARHHRANLEHADSHFDFLLTL